MTALSDLSTDIQKYKQLPHHQNAELATKLKEVQAWQRARMTQTHADLFSEPKNKPMADYFMNNLYGGTTLDAIVEQLERIIPKARKVEKLAPTAAMEAGTMAIRSALDATLLDLNLAQWLLDHDLSVDADNMLLAYRGVNEAPERKAQIEGLKDVCYRTDKHLNSFMLKKGFKLAKGQAYKHNLQPLYDFMDSGFAAMKPLKSVSQFIEPFCSEELEIIEQVHDPKTTSDIFK